MAMQLMNSKHDIGTLVASDGSVWYSNNTSKLTSSWPEYDSKARKDKLPSVPTGDGFKTYKWNDSNTSVDIKYLGHKIPSFKNVLKDTVNGKGSDKAPSLQGPNLTTEKKDPVPEIKKYEKQTDKEKSNVFKVTGHLTGAEVRLRSTPTAKNSKNILGYTAQGDEFEYLGQTKGADFTWYHVRMTSGTLEGKTGYIVQNYASLNTKK